MAQTAAWKEERGIQGNWVCLYTKLLWGGYSSVAPSSSVPLSLVPTPASFLLSFFSYSAVKWVSTYKVDMVEVSVFGADSLSQMGSRELGATNNFSEQDEVPPVTSKSLPTIVLEPQRRMTFMPNLRSQPFLFPRGRVIKLFFFFFG